jgi:hypothetical protein
MSNFVRQIKGEIAFSRKPKYIYIKTRVRKAQFKHPISKSCKTIKEKMSK